MKKVNLLFATIFVAIITLSSCSSDDNTVNEGENGNEETGGGNPGEEDIEDREIPVSELADGITIQGGEKKSGSAPAPTGDVDFKLGFSEQNAFLTNGFDIDFTSTDPNIKGAYLQVTDVDGNKIDGYFDITDLKANQNGGKAFNQKKKVSAQAKMEGEDPTSYNINVNFDASLQPGKFCYEICIYDENNNISQIQEVCVNVEAWGGNADLAGEWVFDSEMSDEVESDEAIFECENGQSLTAPYEEKEKDIWTFVLTEDGVYYETYEEKGKRLDTNASLENCEAVYNTPYEENEKFSGNWSYDEDAKTLTAVDFAYEDFLNSANNETYPEGEVYFYNVKVEIVDGKLKITETDGVDDNGNPELLEYYFKKK
ncbi:hypothetical protein [Aquimarina algicola]|uniref:Uncharacterized protein n=1 Tax=Aquimarina algicola TaxID=2589995 RepID=A0A504JA10_9FLAO|nr:hypothetical protein [Aquimarina algicola]TPN87717.1 hypothetical protein FHK87_09065 [Aquimarina algicola]